MKQQRSTGQGHEGNPSGTRCRVAVCYRVCQHWRAPVFARLAATPSIELNLFHGRDIPGTKLVNTRDFSGIPHRQLRTFSFSLRSSGRSVPVLVYPGIWPALSEMRPDVLLCEGGSNFLNNILVYTWAKLHGIPTIWWSLGEIPGRRFAGLGRLYKAMVRRMMRQSTVLLGYSSVAKDHFRAVGCQQPIFVAVNCVDTELVFRRIEAARRRPRDVRASLGIGSKNVLLFVGALTRAKRVDDLIKIFAIVKRTRMDTALVIVGDGESRAELEELVRAHEVHDVYFTGTVVEDVSHFFLAADLFVLPGLGGLAISEAMCHSLPILCTLADGCERDLVRSGINGHVLAPGDIQGMAASIVGCLEDRDALRSMGNMSRRIIEEEHNIETYMANIRGAIECAAEFGVKRRS